MIFNGVAALKADLAEHARGMVAAHVEEFRHLATMQAVHKVEWFNPSRSDFWNDPNRWDGIDDPHAEMFWMKRHIDRIDCSAPNAIKAGGPTIARVRSGRYQAELMAQSRFKTMAEYQKYVAGISQSTQSAYANAQGSIFGRIFG